ncbi:hypothetical protein [Nocardioides antri]|uniref:Uncharacterized protein n=1 Tax=Nocardioides antri TaxID=2607659 RepID=A0A5B1LU59_9ACTN|nr:hypothetical protein [Nocardioides antri]KAA1423189.1 hypothetical protein F0U47_20140 [Nocardioides antri]
MNESTVSRKVRLPLPRNEDHVAWVVDQYRRKDRRDPSNYETPATAWVHLAMPDRGQVRAERLLARLADFADRMQGDLHDEFRVPRDFSCDDLAQIILAKALVEKGTPFAVYNIEPSGRAFYFYRLIRLATWHPDAPRPKGDA